MSRGTRVSTIFSVCLVFWGLAYFQTDKGTYQHDLVKVFPSYLIMLLGCYAMFQIGLNIFSIRDCPQDHQALLEDVKRARSKLPKDIVG